MASPQLENGYTKIVNELLEAIYISPFTCRELKIILVIIRFTYGFNRKYHGLATSFISEATNIYERHVKSVLKNLIERNIVIVIKEHRGVNPRVLQLNKDYETWIFKHNKVLFKVTKKSPLGETNPVTKRSDQNSTQEINNKNNTKYNNHNGHDSIVTLNENKFPEIVTEIISDFFSLYKIYKGKEHPKLKSEQREKIYEQIGNFIDEHEYIDSYMSDMIDKYFNTKFNKLKCDYNINHFCTEGILTNLMYEIRGY